MSNCLVSNDTEENEANENPPNEIIEENTEYIKKKELFTKELFEFLKKDDKLNEKSIEKRGINQKQIDYIIDILLNAKNKEKKYYYYK